ncbi:MAG TPA: glycogen/starch synthase [Candidatus Udaeobacter sp.]|nr:glycogen/starch synthase [Candidatus Udaeobacter sp.]
MISAEGPPLQRTSALVDVMDALPAALRARGHDVCVVLPFYREIRENRAFKTKNTGIVVDVQVGDKIYSARYLEGRSHSGVQLFLVRCDELFDRDGVYAERGKAYDDNASRFIFLCKAALELSRRLTPQIQILHAHDWAAALVPVFVNAQGLPFRTVLTIHHVEEQGSFWGLDFGLTNLPERFFTLHGVEFFGRLNFLKGGILYAEKITTVSEQYRREILTPSGGHGLDGVLRENAYRLIAILDGADYKLWSPASDDLLPARYDEKKLSGKQVCRDLLLRETKLASAPQGPVLGMVTRVVQEKGFEILVPLLDRLLWDDVRLIILGEGDPAYETALAMAARKFPTKFAYRKDYDVKLAHLIEAGMDISLIPSRIEPAGLSAMYNLKYGALPVARATGGIHQIIEDYDPNSDSGYGFLCYEYSSEAFWDAIKRARQIFEDRTLWTKLMKRAMARNFSWDASAQRYEALYREILGSANQAAA